MRKGKLTLFFDYHYACFWLGHLASQLFSNSPLWVPLITIMQSSLPPGYRRPIWSEWALPDGPLWASFVLSAFGHFSRGPVSGLTVLRTIQVQWTKSGQSLLVLCSFPLISHIVHLLYNRFTFCFNDSCFVLFKHSLLNCFISRFMLISASYWNYCNCSYSDSWVFQGLWSCKQVKIIFIILSQ